MEKRYLVYKSWNGQTHAEIQYGDHQTGTDKKKSQDEIKRFEIKRNSNDIELLKVLYPLEVKE